MDNWKARPAILIAVAAALALAAGACGGDDEANGGGSRGSVDLAFVQAMIPHHESAVDMAKVAQQRSERPEIQRLARAIVATQEAEIGQLREHARRLTDAGLTPGDIGVAEHQMGTGMDPAELRTARPFDREFIDAMIPHHQGAIRMARMQLETGRDGAIKQLATSIESAQTKEIDQMNMWRVSWYGEPSPAGGVPQEEGGGAGHDMS